MQKFGRIALTVFAMVLLFALAGSCAVNLVSNPSFEEIDEGNPFGNGGPRPIAWGISGSSYVSA